MLTLFGYVVKNLGRQKLRTFLAALGVMLGVWLVVVFAAISAGAVRTAEAMLTQFEEDFQVYKAGAADQFLSTLPEVETRRRVREVPGVADTASVLFWFSRAPEIPFALMVGLREEEFAYERLMERGKGGFSTDGADEIVLGESVRKRLGVERGGTLKLEGTTFTISGTFFTGMPLYDNAMVVPLGRLQEFRGGSDPANFIAVRVAEDRDPAEVAAEIERALPELSTVSTLDELAKVDQSLERMKTVSLVITVVATLLGFLFVLIAMVMSVFERTREIGILRSVGWRKRQIVAVILIEAVLLSVAGVIAGIPTGLAAVELVAVITELGRYIEPTYEAALYLKPFLVALLAAGIGGVYPAWRASRLHPVEAIRHE